MTENNYNQYFSEESLWEKLKKYAKVAGTKVVYAVLLLYYTMQSKGTGIKTKLSIAAALGYFILPTDAIIDLAPLIGYSDDLGVLLFALSQISKSITPEIKTKARQKLNDWFGEVDPGELREIDERVG
ncbi:MAG: YkvA family protein [Draconibacterium sp.]